MTTTFGLYDTAYMLAVLSDPDFPSTPTSYYLDNFYKRTYQSLTAQILFDKILGTRRLAPFVAPNVQGRVHDRNKFTTEAFAPAYVKPKQVFDMDQAMDRLPGETLLGAYSPVNRAEIIMANNLEEQRNMILRRMEWMAACGMIYSQVTVAGEDYPSQTVAFGRDSSLTVTLSGSAEWSAPTTADPLGDISSLRKNIRLIGRAKVNRLTFGQQAWDWFIKVPAVYQMLSTRYTGAGSTLFNRGIDSGDEVEYKGTLAGAADADANGLDMFVDNSWYEDTTGTQQQFLPTNYVLMSGDSVQGVRAFGAIRDLQAGLAPLEMFPKMWDNQDPSVRYQMTQSAPLMIPTWPNATGVLIVG